MKTVITIEEILKQQGRIAHAGQWIKKAVHKNKAKYGKHSRRENKVTC